MDSPPRSKFGDSARSTTPTSTPKPTSFFNPPANNPGKNLFGAPSGPSQPSGFSFAGEKPATQQPSSLFANPKPSGPSNLFGQPTSNTTKTSSGPSNLFGAGAPAFPPPSQKNGSAGLFGAPSQPPPLPAFGAKPAETGGLFGAKPTTGDAFNAPKATGGLFGGEKGGFSVQPSKPAPSQTAGSTLFGAKPAVPVGGAGLFNSNPPQASKAAAGAGFFNTKPSQPAATTSSGTGTLFSAKPTQPTTTSGTGTLFSTKPTAPAPAFNTKPAAPTAAPFSKQPASKPSGSDLFSGGTMFNPPKTTAPSNFFSLNSQEPSKTTGRFPTQQAKNQFSAVEDDVDDLFMGAANTYANNDHDDAPYELDDDLLGEDNFRVSRRYHVPGKEPAAEEASIPLTIPDSYEFLRSNPESFILTTKRLTDELLGRDEDVSGDGDITPTRAMRRARRAGEKKPVGERFHKAFQKAAAESDNDDLKEAYAVSVLLVPLYDSLGGTTHQEHRARQVFTEWASGRNSLDEEQIQELFDYEPSPASSRGIWSMMNKLAIHGRMQDLEELLAKCDWSRSANPQTGATYRKEEIALIRACFKSLARLIPQAPIGSNDPAKWRVWRGMVINNSEEVKTLAHPPTAQELAIDEAEFFLKKQRGAARAGLAGRRPIPKHPDESSTPLPRNIEQALLTLYKILEGDVSVVYQYVDDWEGALVYKLTWSRYKDAGDIETDPDVSLATSRRFNQSVRRAMNPNQRKQTKPPIWRLKQYFEEVTKQIPINSSDTAQLVLSKVVTGNWKGALDVMRKSWGIVSVVAFIVEYSKVHNWPGANDPFLQKNNTFINRFGREELDLLQRDKPDQISWADKVLAQYAVGLMGLGDVQGVALGWELGMDVIDRIGNQEWAQELRSKLVVQLSPSKPGEVDALLSYAVHHNLQDEAKQIAEEYANSAPLPPPGLRLKYLSVAHIRPQLHNLIQAYLARSLLAAQAFPIDEEIDEDFDKLLREPPDDDLLRFELAGYATVRMYFTARQQEENHVAARALAALIRSAGEQLSEREAVSDIHASVDWWTSYVLLGEALDLLGNKEQYFELQDLFDILRVIEALVHLPESTLESPRQLYDMAIHNTAGGLHYPATKDETWNSVRDKMHTLGSVKNLRTGWRKRKFTVKEMIACLRVVIAQEIGRAWLEEEN